MKTTEVLGVKFGRCRLIQCDEVLSGRQLVNLRETGNA